MADLLFLLLYLPMELWREVRTNNLNFTFVVCQQFWSHVLRVLRGKVGNWLEKVFIRILKTIEIFFISNDSNWKTDLYRLTPRSTRLPRSARCWFTWRLSLLWPVLTTSQLSALRGTGHIRQSSTTTLDSHQQQNQTHQTFINNNTRHTRQSSITTTDTSDSHQQQHQTVINNNTRHIRQSKTTTPYTKTSTTTQSISSL